MSPRKKMKKVVSKGKAKERTYLTEEEQNMMKPLILEWMGKKDKNSKDAFIASDILPKIQALNPEKYGPDIISKDKASKEMWDKRVQAVHTWMKNNKPFKERAVFKLERKLSDRRIVGKLHADRVDATIKANSPDLETGDKSYPGLYQRALTEVMQGLTDEEMEEVEKTKEEWQESGPPIDMRLKAAKKYSCKGIKNAHELLHKEMYVSCVDFVFFPNPDSGQMNVICHDYISAIHARTHGKSIKTFSEWSGPKFHPIVQQMVAYANYVDHQRNDSEADTVVMVEAINFDRGPGELPLLPEPVNGIRGSEIAKQAGEIIRAYFLRHYQLATGIDNSKTPWATMSEDSSKFFDLECIPADFHIQDPSRMGSNNLKELLKHLRERQKILGVNAFHFHHVMKEKDLIQASYPEAAKDAISAGADAKNWAVSPLKTGTGIEKVGMQLRSVELPELRDMSTADGVQQRPPVQPPVLLPDTKPLVHIQQNARVLEPIGVEHYIAPVQCFEPPSSGIPLGHLHNPMSAAPFLGPPYGEPPMTAQPLANSQQMPLGQNYQYPNQWPQWATIAGGQLPHPHHSLQPGNGLAHFIQPLPLHYGYMPEQPIPPWNDLVPDNNTGMAAGQSSSQLLEGHIFTPSADTNHLPPGLPPFANVSGGFHPDPKFVFPREDESPIPPLRPPSDPPHIPPKITITIPCWSPSTASPTKSTPGKQLTKRKRIEEEFTPSKSGRKRRPSQKLRESGL